LGGEGSSHQRTKRRLQKWTNERRGIPWKGAENVCQLREIGEEKEARSAAAALPRRRKIVWGREKTKKSIDHLKNTYRRTVAVVEITWGE